MNPLSLPKVRCVDNTGHSIALTNGHIYEVVGIEEDFYILLHDNLSGCYKYAASRFKIIEEEDMNRVKVDTKEEVTLTSHDNKIRASITSSNEDIKNVKIYIGVMNVGFFVNRELLANLRTFLDHLNHYIEELEKKYENTDG